MRSPDLVAHSPAWMRVPCLKDPGELIERVDGDVGTLARFFSRFVVSVVAKHPAARRVLVLLFSVDWRIGLGSVLIGRLGDHAENRSLATPLLGAERQESANFYGLSAMSWTGWKTCALRGANRGCATLRRGDAVWLRGNLQAQHARSRWLQPAQGLFGLGAAHVRGLSVMLARDDH